MGALKLYINQIGPLFRLVTLFFLGGTSTWAQPDIQLKSEISANLSNPMHVTHAGDGSGRIFISERGGIIKVFNSAFAYQGEYLNISSLISTSGEGGLLSIAFHPNFETNGCLFVHYTDQTGKIIVARYDSPTPASNVMTDPTPVIVLPIDHPATNHYGGEMHFGQDGYLYISVGDGGGSNDPNNHAQNTNDLLGKILRINVATTGSGTYSIPADNPFPTDLGQPRNEVYAIGLRNPFRWSFDSATGDMWIGDVGQGAEEEIDHCPAAMIKGANFGWRCYEGAIRTPAYNTPTYQVECSAYSNFIPRYSYDHSLGESVIGGVVYHGSRYPMMDGYYIGSDYFSGIFHIIMPESETGRMAAIMLDNKVNISDFGEGENGEIYAVSMSENSLFRFVDANVDPLPVSLISFTGVPSIEGVKLSWKTTREENFSHFDIQTSPDGKSFAKAGSISGRNFDQGSEYSFTHSDARRGMNYYRLKMVDIDGSFSFSKILSVESEMAPKPLVLPSVITSATMTIRLENAYATIELINAAGKNIFTQKLTSAIDKIEIPIGEIPSSIYIVKLSGARVETYTQKIIVAR